MQDRPDLIQSELAGLAFDSLQQVFRKGDIVLAFDSPGLPFEQNQMIWIVIDPAAGGPQSDYAVVSLVRNKGCVQVSHDSTYSSSHFWMKVKELMRVSTKKDTISDRRSMRKRVIFACLGPLSMLRTLLLSFSSTLSKVKNATSKLFCDRVSTLASKRWATDSGSFASISACT